MQLEISQVVITIVVACLFLWRISYGTNNGLFAEAAGLIAVYFAMRIAGNLIGNNYGDIIPKVGYLFVAFFIYSLMTRIGKALREIRQIPILGQFDRLLGAILGFIEAYLIIYIVEYITGLSSIF